MSIPMMKCGHAANATTKRDGKDIQCCVICSGIRDGWDEIELETNLNGRRARCSYYQKHCRRGSCDYGGTSQADGICRCDTSSSTGLPFFELKPNAPFDEFYCGCHGWN